MLKKGNRRKRKKSADNQAEYYYPVKTNNPDKDNESNPPKATYSLRKRNKETYKRYLEKSEDDFEDEEYEESDIRPVGVCFHLVFYHKQIVLAFRMSKGEESQIIKTLMKQKINSQRSTKIRNTNCRILLGILKGMNLIT